MTTEIVPYTSREEWLAARVHDITSTECAALFGASPYVTAFELYHSKRSGVVEQRRDNPRMKWGRRLQEPIALGVALDHGLEVRAMTEYIRDADYRIGSSFDYRIVGARGTEEKTALAHRLLLNGEGLMEIKTVDPYEFKAAWVIEDGDALEAPPHIELQVQHQLLVSGLQWALIVALVGGNRVSVIERAFDLQLAQAIITKAREFWQLVDQGTPPAPDYTRDAETIARLYVQSTAGKVLDAREDSLLSAWVEHYHELGEEVRDRAKQREAIRAQILERVGDAQRVLLPEFGVLSASTVGETIVPAHTRSAYRNLRYYPRKGQS